MALAQAIQKKRKFSLTSSADTMECINPLETRTEAFVFGKD